MKRFWLMKSEPDAFSIDDLARQKRTHWDGVRSYQARNFMRDRMGAGDSVLFYHSSCEAPGAVGLARVARPAYPDFTAWDRKSRFFDPRSTPEKPVWYMVDVEFVEKFQRPVTLAAMKSHPLLASMRVCRKGARLSIQPVSREHFNIVCRLGRPCE